MPVRFFNHKSDVYFLPPVEAQATLPRLWLAAKSVVFIRE